MKYSRNFQYLSNSQETHACWKLPHTISSLSCSLHSSNDFQLCGYCRDFVYNLKYCLWEAWRRQYNTRQEVTYLDPIDNDIHRCLVCIKWKVLYFVYEYYCHSVIGLGPYCNHTVVMSTGSMGNWLANQTTSLVPRLSLLKRGYQITMTMTNSLPHDQRPKHNILT